ncbi:MAG: class I SAM-dependent methyltransferase [Nostocaceae cyanobacterium]|nr:class I SAM-dependent methyltransferase [Nostocaceae cyanobacterium]
MNEVNYNLGCVLPNDTWTWLNRIGAFETQNLRQYVAPFPPPELMHIVSALQNEKDFAAHGVDIWQAVTKASPIPLVEFKSILDFGCGCGRLGRMFKGHPHLVTGCDIDPRHVKWVEENLTYMKAIHTSVHPPLPFANNEFDAIISISVFTHLNEQSQDEFLADLHRICAPNGYLFLTVHGLRAFERAVNETMIRDLIAVDEELFQKACRLFEQNQHAFILQQGHLTTYPAEQQQLQASSEPSIINEPFEYGITFIPENYIREHWTKWFYLVDYCHGAIHSFQDIVVLKPKK